jgi:hypothetical protein
MFATEDLTLYWKEGMEGTDDSSMQLAFGTDASCISSVSAPSKGRVYYEK